MADLFDLGGDAFYVDSVWLLAQKSKEDGTIGRMSAASERQRAEQFYRYLFDRFERPSLRCFL